MSSFPCPLLCRKHWDTQKSDTFIAAIGAPVQLTIEHTADIGMASRAGPRMERTSFLRPTTSPLRDARLDLAGTDVRSFSGTETLSLSRSRIPKR
jgi:hypothetical protein